MMKTTGSVQEKNGRFYFVINLYDANGKRKIKWISTGLTVRGNKRKAESSHIKSCNGDKFPHGVNDLIGVQDTDGKCSISKIHEMLKIDGNIPIFSNF